MMPHPAISPFDNRFEQTTITDGLWTRFTSNANRKHFTSFEYLNTKVRHSKGLIGHRRAPSYKDVYLPILATEGTGGGGGGGNNQQASLEDQFQGDADFIDGIGTFPAVGNVGFNLFNARHGDYAAEVNGQGFRFITGFTEADGSGLMIDFWINGEANSDFNAAKALTFRGRVGSPASAGVAGRAISEQGFLGTILSVPQPDSTMPVFAVSDLTIDLGQADPLMVLSRSLLNLSSIPIDDGTLRPLSDGTYLGGTAVPYDLSFRLKYKTESLGTSLSIISSRSIRKKFFKANFVFGGRYLYINEAFRFEGEDSGLAYDTLDTDDNVFSRAKVHSLPNFTDDDSNFVVDEAILVEDQMGGGGGGATDGRAIRLDLVAAAGFRFHPGRYQAFLESKMTTNLMGPEVGFNYTLGGKKFRLRGLTKFGLLANVERISLSGNNIGDANNIGDDIDLDLLMDPLTANTAGVQDSPLLAATPNNQSPNAFASSQKTTHVSPLFEQRITAEFPIFRYIPMLKRRDTLQNAHLTAGWSVIWIGEVARPSQSILWRANPRAGLFPTIDIERADWWTMNWSLGLTIPF